MLVGFCWGGEGQLSISKAYVHNVIATHVHLLSYTVDNYDIEYFLAGKYQVHWGALNKCTPSTAKVLPMPV
jgi:hypothetical protein